MAEQSRNKLVDIDAVDAENVVAIADGTEHGYIGFTPDETPNEDYTVAGVTRAGTAHTSDKPPAQPTAKARANTAALKNTGKSES